MENIYGIGVANRYALFLDDETDPLETLNLKEQEKELRKKNKIAEKENTKTKTEQQPNNNKSGKNNLTTKKPIKENTIHKNQDNKREGDAKNNQRSNVDGKPERSFNKLNNENREERNNKRNREDRQFNGPAENRDRDERPRRDNNNGDNFDNRNRERGERGERGGDRGGRSLNNKPSGPRGPRRNFDDRRGKREFDRQSGSDKTHGYRGVKSVDKRDGAGAHNWGSHKDVIEEADKTNDAEQSWNENEKPDTSAQTEQKEENEVENPVEEEPKELTLDEWKAQRAGRVKPQYNIRKAGEGEDPTQWKKMYELRKKDNESESEEEEYDVAEYPQRVGRQKHIFDIDIKFNDNRHAGGGRGRGPRSGPRGNRQNQRGGGGGGGSGIGSGGVGNATGSGIGGNSGVGGAGNGNNPGADRNERRYRDEQGDDKNENRRAPKVDDERDFPSLG